MAELKAPVKDELTELEDIAEKLEDMANKQTKTPKKPKAPVDELTTAVKREDTTYKGPTSTVFLPEIADDGSMKVDQYEHVTIANEKGEDCYKVRRGEFVEVPVPVYLVLKERYPKI